MRRFLMVGVLSLIFLAPVAAMAWAPGQPIVPQCQFDQGGDGPYCTACDLVNLVNNLLAFAVYFTSFVAAIMFAYAGFLYVTAASNAENISKAKSVFGKVLLGFVFVLTAWLIVDIVLSTLTNKDFGFWTNLDCRGGFPTLEDALTSTVSTGGGGGGLPYDAGAETSMRANLASKGIEINKDPCSTSGQTNCTNVGGLKDTTVNGLVEIEKQCSTCQVTVTGGTEQGVHKTHTGREVDLRKDPATVQFLSDPANRTKVGISSCIDEGDHLHCVF